MEIPYGSSTQSAEFPANWNIVPLTMSKPAIASRSERDIVLSALQQPVDSPGLTEMLKRGNKLAVIVSDKTRKCRTDVFLPCLLDIVEEAGIPREAVTIVFANGTHAPQSIEEIIEVLGKEITDTYHVIENHAKENEHVLVGTTRFGTPIEIHKAVASADVVIAAGTIVHHYFAGYGGGAKLFMPGVASYNSAVTNHKRTLDHNGDFHAMCRDGVVEGNPVADDIWDAVRFYPPCFYFASILDESGSIIHAVCGDMNKAHKQGSALVDSMYAARIEQKADAVIVSPGGYPKDINLIQSHKALHHASYAVKDGGIIICLAECRDGIGNPSFMQWFDHDDDREMKQAVLSNYAMNAHTAIALRQKCRNLQIIFVSELPDEDVLRIGMTPAIDFESAITIAKALLPEKAQAYFIDNGFLLVPLLQPQS
jgi:lactate racemase